MKELLKNAKDFKIVPNNFKSCASFEIIKINDYDFEAKLSSIGEDELSDYNIGSNVEIFSVNNLGLIYFETKIIDREGYNIKLAIVQDFSIIQRREYSRVGLSQGKIIFNDLSNDFLISIEDISAGGIKFISSSTLDFDKKYSIVIELSANMKIECKLQPTRIQEVNFENKKAYSISGRFIDLENADRIILVQYAFKIKMEQQNKENN